MLNAGAAEHQTGQSSEWALKRPSATASQRWTHRAPGLPNSSAKDTRNKAQELAECERQSGMVYQSDQPKPGAEQADRLRG